MGCIYSHNGECEFYDSEDLNGIPSGCTLNGECNVEDDPVPSDNCDVYESDSVCSFCYADFNADEECTCGEDE